MKSILVHVTTADISLELLLGPQLSAYRSAGFDVIGVSAPGPFVDEVTARGVRHIALDNATRAMDPSSDARAMLELIRLFRDLRPTIVHTHNPKPGLYGRIAARAARVPVVVNTVHGLYATSDDPLRKRAVVYGLERIASCASDVELIQNVEDLRLLRSLLRVPTSKLTLLGNGVDLARFSTARSAEMRSAVRAELGIDDEAVVVGAVGRLVEEKGYRELLTAWSDASAAHPEAVLVVVGPHDAQKADALDPDLVRSAEEQGVRFVGMRDDVERLYCAMDVYVLASHREGFPRSAMEAAAAGLPIIATDIRGCRQVVDDGRNGLLVPVRNAAALGAAIRNLLADPSKRAAYGDAGAQRAVEEFDQEAIIATTLATYQRLMVASGISPP